MPSIGPNSTLVKILHKKTKIKSVDIIDLLRALPEGIAEAFFQANPDEKEPVNFGALNVHWKNTNLGPGIFFKPASVFQKHVSRIKYEQKTAFATTLYEKMLPINRERVVKSIETSTQNFAKNNP